MTWTDQDRRAGAPASSLPWGTGYNAPMNPSRPDEEDISDDVTQDRPMGTGTVNVKKAQLESNETVELARIASKERIATKELDTKAQTSLWGTVGKLVGGIIVVIGLFGLAYWATQGVDTTIEHEGTTVTVGGSE